jgi:hypothetical protein
VGTVLDCKEFEGSKSITKSVCGKKNQRLQEFDSSNCITEGLRKEKQWIGRELQVKESRLC